MSSTRQGPRTEIGLTTEATERVRSDSARTLEISLSSVVQYPIQGKGLGAAGAGAEYPQISQITQIPGFRQDEPQMTQTSSVEP
jgi:hypothetical protein